MTLTFLTIIALLIFEFFLLRGKNIVLDNTGESVLLELSKVFYFFSFVTGSIGVFCLFIPLSHYNEEDFYEMLISFHITAGFFLANSLYFYFKVKKHYLLYDSDGVSIAWVFRKSTRFIWDDIYKCKFNSFTNEILLYHKNGEVYKISKYLTGINEFLTTLKLRSNVPKIPNLS